MNNVITFCIMMFAILGMGYAQNSFTGYRDLRDFQVGSPGSFKAGLFGFDNPALLNYNHSGFDLAFMANDKGDNLLNFDRTALFVASNSLSFGVINNKMGDVGYTDYRISTGFGGRRLGFGLSYGWSSTRGDIQRSSNMMTVGTLLRPSSNLSLAANYSFSLDNAEAEYVGELALRPFGNEWLTIFADISYITEYTLNDVRWSAGFVFEPLAGIRLNARRFFDDNSTALSVNVSTGLSDYTGLSQIDQDNNGISNTFGIRIGGLDRTLIKDVFLNRYYAVLDLSSGIKYVKNMYFDNSLTLLEVLTAIDKAAYSKSVMGIVVNATEFSSSRSIMWEVRKKLEDFKKENKTVVIFLERANIDLYHFASVADYIVLDPLGSITLEGFALGRSYYKKLLDKADIGFEELRYYKYKSAAESFSREGFSEGEREQRQKIVDDWYELAKYEISKSRKNLAENFDYLVDNKIGIMANEAHELKMVDKFDRWNNLMKFMKEYDWTVGLRNIFNLDRYARPFDDKWSDNENRIAVVYAEGQCDLNSGIQARRLSDYLNYCFEDDRISAIVLRVDSPGGDAMASDLIAKVISDNKGKKPVIVSQGQVAASGGYWLSMEADKIVAAPNTVTGSIGVISSWFYDKGLKDSLGISYDLVKRGKYADFGASYSLPFLPIGLPIRNMTEDEKEKREIQIRSLYSDFVKRVSKARNMTFDNVDSIAQGRVWSGTDAKNKGLVDEIGNLYDAINMAKDAAGISRDDEVQLIEYPVGKWLDWSQFFGGLFNVNIPKINEEFDEFMFLLKNNGLAMPVLPIDYWK